MKKMTMIVRAALLSFGLSASSAMGIEISYTDYGVGYWTPANEFNSDPDLPDGVQRVVDIWNGTALAGLWDPPGNDDATFVQGAGVLLPLTLPDVTQYVSRDEGSPFSVDNSGGEFTYLTAKYGNEQQRVFYIADIHDVISVPTSLPGIQGSGLSHLAWLRADSVSTPDGGTTALMLAGALGGLWLIRRRF